MARTVDPRKHAVWRRRLARYQKGSQSAPDFCKAEGVTLSTFYWWKRTLSAAEDQEVGKAAESTPADNQDARRERQGLLSPVEASDTTSETMTIELPGGVRLELPTGNLDLVRTVVESIVRGDYSHTSARKK